MDLHSHWDRVYRSREPQQVSWFQAEPRVSLSFIEQAAPNHLTPIVDVGGGASTLVDGLLAAGYRALSVLDLSSAALAMARQRLGDRGLRVTWIEGDVRHVPLRPHAYGVWHDRAVFHFLTSAQDRARYLAQLRQALAPDGHVVMATFAEDGPTSSGGLEVVRYAPDTLSEALGDSFVIERSVYEVHRTPWDASQAFLYCSFRYLGD